MSAPIFFLLHAFALLALAATVYVAGRLAVRRLAAGSAWEAAAVAVALGFTLFGHLGLFLGLAGQLNRWPLLAAVAAVHLAGLGVWRETLKGFRKSGFRIVSALGLMVAAAPLALLALYPPSAFDETLYHLPFARAFVRTGGLPFLPELRVPVFPQLAELLFAEMMLLAGDVATHLVSLLATAATAALLAGWGRRAASPAAGWLAAGIWLGSPIVAHLTGTAYVEPLLALFAAAALYAQERWRETGSRGWLVLAGVFAGSAAGVKYLGLGVAGVVFLLVVGGAWGAPRERRLRDPLLFALVVGAVLAPWYARIFYLTGNPLFPFFPALFGRQPSPWDFGGSMASRSLPQRLAGIVRLPWDVSFARARVGYQPPYSPVYLVGLPWLAAVAWRGEPRRLLRRLLGFALGYSLFFLLLPPDSRYLIAALPAVSLALALAVASSGAWVRPRLLAALALVAFLPGWIYAGYRLVQQGPVPTTAAARDRYLAERLSVWPAVRFLNRVRGSGYTVYAFHAENMVYLAEGKFLGDWNGPARFGLMEPLLRDPAALHRELREIGAGYLLIVSGRGPAPPYDDPEFRRRFQRVYSDGASEVFAVGD